MRDQTATPRDTEAPPPAIGSSRVIAYAVVNKDVRYTGKQRLFVDGKLLGRVPKIVICKSLRKGFKNYLILFCDKNWQERGGITAKSLPQAKKSVECYYAGISSKWVTVSTSEKAAKRWLAENYPNDICSFCGKFSYEFDVMFLGRSAVICPSCIDAFADELRRIRAQG